MGMFKKSVALLLSMLMVFSLCSVTTMTAFADEATTVSTVAKYFPACDSSETGIAAALDSIGVDSSKAYRTVIAQANGIENYSGTAEQNTAMLNLLKQGLLINPEYVESETTESTEPTQETTPTEDSTESTEPTEPEENSVNIALNQTVTFEYGKQVTANASWGADVVNAGLSVLTDGVNSTTTYAVNNGNVLIGLKQDYIKGPYSFTVDLGGRTSIDRIAAYFYDRSNWSVEMPEEVKYYVSSDGADWALAGTVTSEEAETTVLTDTKYPNDQSPSIGKLQLNESLDNVKYVKIVFDAYTDSSIAIALAEIEVYGEEIEKEEADVPNVDLGSSFDAFVYNITSWKLLTPAEDGNAVIHERNSSAQVLSFEKNSDSSYYIYTADDKYLTVEDTNVIFVDKTGSDKQKWFIKGDDGFYKFRSVYAANCYLEVADNSRENFANVQLNTATEGNEQYFQILEGTYQENGYDRGYKGGSAGDGVIFAHGLDLSKYNSSTFDFTSAKAQGIDYIIVRIGSTKTGLDPLFETHYKRAKAAGLDVGGYYYSYATTTAGARKDAEDVLGYIAGKTFEYPIYFDYEDASQDSLSQQVSKSLNLTFMTIMANKGYLSGMYTGLAKANTLLMDDICEIYDSWIARYYDGNYIAWPEYSNIYGMWQYTDSLTLSGISGGYDANVSYKNYPAIVKEFGFNGYSTGKWTESNEYVYDDGTYASGWTEIGTKWHYFDESACKTGEFSLSKNGLRLETGATDTLTVTTLSSEDETDAVVWASANEDIVTVDQNGNVTALSAGLSEITATWKGMTLTCYIEIADPVYKDYITVRTLPKTEYFYGEEFDSKGMQVRLYYTNNSYEIITDYELSGYESTLGTKTITVSYEEFTTTFDVTVSLEEKVGIYGDINLDFTTEDEELYTGTVKLNSGTYNFNINNMGISLGSDGTFTNVIDGAVYSPESTSATVLNATGGIYTFIFNASTNVLTVEHTYALGDANCDGEIDINDVTYIQKILAHLTTSTDEAIQHGDVDGNGKLSIRDVTYIQMYIAKYIDTFPAQELNT